MVSVPESECTIVVPAYNEAKRISYLLESAGDFGGSLIFVCDGDDDTAPVIEAYAGEHPGLNISCLTFGERLGKGGGVIAGMEASDTPYVGFMDADGSTSVPEMVRLFGHLSSADCAIGSRWLSGSRLVIEQSRWRKFQSRVFNLAVRLLFGLCYRDTQCGAKVFREDAVRAVLPELSSRGFEFDVELLWRLKERGCSVDEIPIVWEDKGDSSVKGSDGLGMLKSLVAIRFCRT